jgi:hypothetical protein
MSKERFDLLGNTHCSRLQMIAAQKMSLARILAVMFIQIALL